MFEATTRYSQRQRERRLFIKYCLLTLVWLVGIFAFAGLCMGLKYLTMAAQ
jgi:hypothetical protein